jgi:hypothetical protein
VGEKIWWTKKGEGGLLRGRQVYPKDTKLEPFNSFEKG